MVLESISNPFQAENKPSILIGMGFVYSIVAIFLATWIFKDQASIVFVFLIVLASIPLMRNIIKEEEEKDLKNYNESYLLKEHAKALIAFMSLFLGVVLGVTISYVYTPVAVGLAFFFGMFIFSKPQNITKKFTTITFILALFGALILGAWSGYEKVDLITVFQTQSDTINQINGRITGFSTNNSIAIFSKIFFNNIKVLIFCILFSFLYGSGAIFILTWNASVIGTAMGNFIRSNLASVAQIIGFEKAGNYLTIISKGLFKYIIHGIPEILGYFVAALAGGIISIGVIKHDFQGRKFEHILLDSVDLILLSIGIIFMAAVLEVWITPLIF